MWWVPDGRWHEAAGLPSGRAELGRMETHCLAGVGGLKLRNVVAKYPFERSHRFPLIGRIPATANSFGVFRQTILIVAAFASRNADPHPTMGRPPVLPLGSMGGRSIRTRGEAGFGRNSVKPID